MTKEQKAMSFEEYKIIATKNDVKMMESKMKIKHWENIPIFGALAYTVRMGIEAQGIDRGPLRKAYTKWNLIALLIGVIYIYSALIMITPWLMYGVIKKAINETKTLIAEDKI